VASTKGVTGGFFTRHTRIAFGHGCDHSSYVSALDNGSAPVATTEHPPIFDRIYKMNKMGF
jgi:hypothetical protein